MENAEEYQEIVEGILEGSPYRKKEADRKNYMSVAELGELLGLGKTERYWLLHKGYFKTTKVNGKNWIDISSFETWYANQIKYRKVDGEEPGRSLREWSYSVRDIAGMLEREESTVYELIKKEGIATVKVDSWIRIPKEEFDRWYAGQGKYRTEEDREHDRSIEEATITMPEMAMLLGISRKKVYDILKSVKYGHFFEFVTIAERRRITKESFEHFLKEQDEYRLDPKNDYKEVALEENARLADYRRQKIYRQGGIRRGNGNQEYLTIQEAALLAKVCKGTVERWMVLGYFPVKKAGRLVRIPREEYEAWLKGRESSRSRSTCG